MGSHEARGKATIWLLVIAMQALYSSAACEQSGLTQHMPPVLRNITVIEELLDARRRTK